MSNLNLFKIYLFNYFKTVESAVELRSNEYRRRHHHCPEPGGFENQPQQVHQHGHLRHSHVVRL